MGPDVTEPYFLFAFAKGQVVVLHSLGGPESAATIWFGMD